ncbi:hypothetical protein [Streptomyces sp. NPDC052036]|uniref:hypothetical protein n=1 Tax=unclassified Streptomyces TaxID=2593676 RepID=UPI00343DAC01
MTLDWPDFQLHCSEEGYLTFTWPSFSQVRSHAGNCAHIRLVPQGSDGAHQWIFQFRTPRSPTPGLVVIRVDVPPDRVGEAEDYAEVLRRRYGIPDRPDDTAEDAVLERVPPGTREWIVASAGAASEELFRHVMARVADDPG